MAMERYDRQIRFFGKEGQEKLRSTHVAVIGVGGVGSHVVQQLALLGVGTLSLIDPDELETTNLNRLIGARYDDPIPGTKKVDIATRMVRSIDPTITFTVIDHDTISKDGFEAIKHSDYVFGCVDNDGARLVLTELCSAYEKPYIDIATEIIPDEHLEYGGRVCCSFDDKGCLMCLDEISTDEAWRYLADSDALKDQESIYGVPLENLSNGGPAVVMINGVVASLAMTEFLVSVTGIRQPQRLLRYYGSNGKVVVNINPPSQDCYYCKGIRGKKEDINIERYLDLKK